MNHALPKRGMFHVKHFALPLLGLLFLTQSACVVSKSPITGRSRAYGWTWSQEREIGQQSDQAIVAQYGVYDDPELTAYVNRVAERVLAQSHVRRPDAAAEFRETPFTFRVLDSPVVNAFALPGGFVYVTRGLLSHLENEAQLAVVIGHEIGHVEARHAAQRAFQQQLGQLGVLGGAILGQTVLGVPAQDILNAAGTATQLLFLKYGRDDERESDELGVEYAALAGYKAEEAAAFFRSLKRIGEQQGEAIPSFLSTHPDPGERETTIRTLAQEWSQRAQMTETDQQSLYAAIDDIVLGDDPRQGYVEQGVFYHPQLRFHFPVPRGYQVVNQAQQVAMLEPNQRAILLMTLAQQKDARTAGTAFAQQQGLQVVEQGQPRSSRYPAYYVLADAPTQEGQILRVLSYYLEYQGQVYNFIGYSARDAFESYQNTFLATMQGFTALTEAARLNVQPIRLNITTAPRTGPFQSFAQQTPLPQDFDAADLAILNQVELETQIQRGTPLKLTQR